MIVKDWNLLNILHGGPFRVLHNPQDLKQRKFLRLFNLTRISSFIYHDGTVREIYSTKD